MCSKSLVQQVSYKEEFFYQFEKIRTAQLHRELCGALVTVLFMAQFPAHFLQEEVYFYLQCTVVVWVLLIIN